MDEQGLSGKYSGDKKETAKEKGNGSNLKSARCDRA